MTNSDKDLIIKALHRYCSSKECKDCIFIKERIGIEGYCLPVYTIDKLRL